jgi:glutathione S-transferase
VQELNKGVSRQEYFSGDDISAADIIIYNEIKTVLVLHKRELVSRETPDLFAWFARLSRM